MKLRWKVLIAVIVFLFLVAASLTVTQHVQPEAAVDAYKKLLLARGEKLEIDEVLPPRVPDESNGVALVESAFSLLAPGFRDYSNFPPVMRMVAAGKAQIGWAQPNLVEPVATDGWTNSWENAVAATEAGRPGIELLRQAAVYPAITFPMDYHYWPLMTGPHLSPLAGADQILAAAAMCDLHNGEGASATTNICLLLTLVDRLRDERTVISQSSRLILSLSVGTTWELLQSTNVADAELAALKKSWERQEFIEAFENGVLMERAATEAGLKKMRNPVPASSRFRYGSSPGGSLGGSGDWLDDIKAWWTGTKEGAAEFLWRTSWTYSDELQMLQGDQIILEALRAINTNHVFYPAYTNMAGQFRTLSPPNSKDDWLIKELGIPDYRGAFFSGTPGLRRYVRNAMAAETARQIALTAIALKRFQLKHGAFPEKLSELTPEFLPSIPLDPVDGNLLRYRADTNGMYLLYSVGDDGVDNGGDTTPARPSPSTALTWNWQRGRDWVWPQPASPAEVEYFYEHPPR